MPELAYRRVYTAVRSRQGGRVLGPVDRCRVMMRWPAGRPEEVPSPQVAARATPGDASSGIEWWVDVWYCGRQAG
jgi:hypothetical protein